MGGGAGLSPKRLSVKVGGGANRVTGGRCVGAGEEEPLAPGCDCLTCLPSPSSSSSSVLPPPGRAPRGDQRDPALPVPKE